MTNEKNPVASAAETQFNTLAGFHVDLTPANTKAVMKEAGATSADLWQVPVGEIKEMENFNLRLDTPDYDEHVDVLFRSAVTVYGGDLLAVVLTGMGSDGRAGCEDVVAAGGTVYAQDERSSVVWGMPGAVATAGLAHRVLPLDQVAHTIVGAVQHATGAPAARASGGAA